MKDYILRKTKRILHLRPSNKKPTAQRILFFDTETFMDKDTGFPIDKFKCGVAWVATLQNNGKHTRGMTGEFTDRVEMCNWILDCLKDNKGLTVMAHNLSFDIQVLKLFEFMLDNGFKIKSLYNKGTTFIIVMKSKFGKITMLDSMNWYPTSLEEIGEQIGDPKWEIDFMNCKDKDLMSYCKQDVRIVLEVMKQYKNWLYDNFKINFGYTRGSDAFRIFKNSTDCKKLIYNNNMDVLVDEFDSYYGGRVECFRIGNFKGDKIYKLDVNSLYPSVMSNNTFSTNFVSSENFPTLESVARKLEIYGAVADVLISTNRNYIPVRCKNMMLFPIGEFNVKLSTAELKRALEYGDIKYVVKIHYYEKEDIFKNLMDKLYDMRLSAKKNNKTIDSQNIKLIMNSIYGKFGQLSGDLVKEQKWPGVKLGVDNLWKEELGRSIPIMIIDDFIYSQERNVIGMNTYPIIASEVCSLARIKMWDLMQIAGMDNLYYMDTDSLFVNQKGHDLLKNEIDPNKLGMLKYEGIVTDLTINGLKNYEHSAERVIKGIPKKAELLSPNRYSMDGYRTFHEFLEHFDMPLPLVRKKEKELSGEYNKGILLPNKRVIPFRLGIGRTPHNYY